MASQEPRRPSTGGRPSQSEKRSQQRPRRRPSERPKTKEVKRPVRRPTQKAKKRRQTAEVTYTPNTWFRIFSLLLVVAVFVAGVAIFFRVETVAVTGNQLYTAEEIQEASGVETGDNLLILSKGDIAGSIMAVLPYVEEVRIGKELPNLVTIDIVESNASYMVKGSDGAWWLINSEGKLLEQAGATAGAYPTIGGLEALDPVAGNDIETEDPDVRAAALAVIEQLETTDYLAKIVEINVEKSYEIIIYYQDIYQIELGGYDDMAYKIQYLTAVLEQLRETETGIIDLTFGEEKVARFRPW